MWEFSRKFVFPFILLPAITLSLFPQGVNLVLKSTLAPQEVFAQGSGCGTINVQVSPSVTSGVFPLAVHFDATGTTDSSVARPFHDLEYDWNFGDIGSGTWPLSPTGASRNTDRNAIAGHLYETAGTFNGSLTVTNPRGDRCVANFSIVVDDPSTAYTAANTFCYARDGSNWNGCPRSCPNTNCVVVDENSDTFALLLANAAPNTRHYFRRGDSFPHGQMGGAASAGPVLIDAFGAGSSPRPLWDLSINLTGIGSQAVTLKSDWTINNIDMDGTGLGAALAASTCPISPCPNPNPLDAADRIILSNMRIANYTQLGIADDSGSVQRHDRISLVNVEWSAPAVTLERSGAWGWIDRTTRSIYLGMNLNIELAPTHNGAWRTVGMIKGVIAHGRFVAADDDGLLSFRSATTDSSWSGTDRDPSRYVIAYDLDLRSGGGAPVRWCDVNSCALNDPNATQARDAIFERNFLTFNAARAGTTNVLGQFRTQWGHVTWRNNVVDLTGTPVENTWTFMEQSGVSSGYTGNLHILNNTFFINPGADSPITFTVCGSIENDNTGAQCRNNLVYAPDSGSVVFDGSNDWTDSNNLNTEGNCNYPFHVPYEGVGQSEMDDFRLASSCTQAINTGFAFPTGGPYVYKDFLNTVRPQGSGFDIGASEYSISGPPDSLAPSAPTSLTVTPTG